MGQEERTPALGQASLNIGSLLPRHARYCGNHPALVASGLFLVDRLKDMIISGGVNVYPRDIEEVIIQHPAVREVAVFGAPDEKWGEVPIAAVVMQPGVTTDCQELIAWTNARVDAKFQRIQDVVVYDEFPRNVAGKTLKREMRAAFAASRRAAG